MSDIVNNNSDICVEAHYGRKRKENTNMSTKFKGVIRGVLISTLIVTSVLGTTMPAFAANDETFRNETNEIVRTYGVSFEEAVSSVTNAINTINSLKANGTVTQAQLETLANSIMDLERATDKTDFNAVSTVAGLLDKAESAIEGVNGYETVAVAIAVSRANLGIEKTTINVQQAKAELKSFSDVPSTHWAYKTVMKAVELGLFQGTTEPDANGVGTFAPDRQMTRAEFITVCIRSIGASPSDYHASQDGGKDAWYDGYWDTAVKKGIIASNAFGGLANLGQPMSREEMAYAAVQTLKYKGEEATDLLDWDRIPDMNSVQQVYQPYVLRAYSMGILCGVNDIGTFNPKGTLNRAQAATVLVRIVEADSRQQISKEKPATPVASHEWKEGERHELAQAGDVVIKADGTKVTLKSTVVGHEANGKEIIVLGVGQGVDLWTGTVIINAQTGTERVLEIGSIANGYYRKSDVSKIVKHGNEVHTQDEWRMITKLDEYKCPTEDGVIEGQIANTFWEWHEGLYNPETGLYGQGAWSLRSPIN